MRDVVDKSGAGSIPPPDAQNAKSLLARCATSRSRRGASVGTGRPGEYVAVAHLIRMAANIQLKADFRNMLERFAKQGDHKKGTIKSIPAYEQGQDLRTGESVLAVFRAGVATEPLYYVGQIRQIVAAIGGKVQKRQVFLSVPCNDPSALIVCYPWAQVESERGTLSSCEEPIEYYRVVTSRAPVPAAAGGPSAGGLAPSDLVVGGDEDECTPQEVVPVSGSSIIMRSVGVDWRLGILTDPLVILEAIQNAHVL